MILLLLPVEEAEDDDGGIREAEASYEEDTFHTHPLEGIQEEGDNKERSHRAVDTLHREEDNTCAEACIPARHTQPCEVEEDRGHREIQVDED